MDKIKSLLLPLALIFAAIAVFETGGRYGATNMRAHAIAGELAFPLSIYVQGKGTMNEQSLDNIAAVIDNGIAAGSMHRQLWYLNKDAKAALDKTLTYAFSVRGQGPIERITSTQGAENLDEATKARLSKLAAAVTLAKSELLDTKQSATTEAPATTE